MEIHLFYPRKKKKNKSEEACEWGSRALHTPPQGWVAILFLLGDIFPNNALQSDTSWATAQQPHATCSCQWGITIVRTKIKSRVYCPMHSSGAFWSSAGISNHFIPAHSLSRGIRNTVLLSVLFSGRSPTKMNSSLSYFKHVNSKPSNTLLRSGSGNAWQDSEAEGAGWCLDNGPPGRRVAGWLWFRKAAVSLGCVSFCVQSSLLPCLGSLSLVATKKWSRRAPQAPILAAPTDRRWKKGAAALAKAYPGWR